MVTLIHVQTNQHQPTHGSRAESIPVAGPKATRLVSRARGRLDHCAGRISTYFSTYKKKTERLPDLDEFQTEKNELFSNPLRGPFNFQISKMNNSHICMGDYCILLVYPILTSPARQDKAEGYVPRQREVLDRFAAEVGPQGVWLKTRCGHGSK